MKAIIIEDEKLSAEHLANLISKMDFPIEISAVYDSVKKSIAALKQQNEIELIFLDIHLADGLSFEIFNELQIDIPIIFTTAYNEFAIKAFELNSIDYLLKPIGKMELEKSIEKLMRLNATNNSETANILKIANTLNFGDTKTYKSRFLVKTGEQIKSIQVAEISHFIFDDGLLFLFTNAGKRFSVDFSVDNLENMLDPTSFFRINRKVIVNIESIEKISSYFNSRLKIKVQNLDEDSSIVSRERVSTFKTLLDS
jgi:DNA-binding LytR/AlgR family response regulator